MESNSRSATDMIDQDQYIGLKEISVDFIKTRPTSDLELVFKDDAGVKYKSDKFKNGASVLWKPDIHVRTQTGATLIIQRGLFKKRVAEISVKFEPYELGDSKSVRLEDSDRCVTVTVVYGKPKPLADVIRVLGSRPTFSNNDIRQHRRQIPEVQFRVLIIGRANAGKTSILQRICETTESPVIYQGGEEVRLDPSMNRGEHTIDDELVFSNNRGYVFHDSRGIESGGTEELDILQDFIRRKCSEKRLRDRLHAIWYCVPMDNQRPELDLRFLKDICPDGNVPVVVVFTKYDQFQRNVQIHVEDFGSPDDNVSDVAEKRFEEYYLRALDNGVRFVRLEKMHKQNMGCDWLIEMTAAALNDDIVRLMLLAVQMGNLELSVKGALARVHFCTGMDIRHIVRECLFPFPYIWVSRVCGFRGSLYVKHADDACPRLSSSMWVAAVAFCVSSLLTTPVLGSPVHKPDYVLSNRSKSHPHHSWRLSFDLCSYPHLQACHLLTSLKHFTGISLNPRGGLLSRGKY
ncbi:hypothetical protein EDB87DRAFT_1834670 [Lactarius vividus]|nr:hypothetical protein EDB87DRAFT_1834670 [Lactarius vividus]